MGRHAAHQETLGSVKSLLGSDDNRHAAWSSVNDSHISYVVTLAGGGREVIQPCNLLGAQLELIGSCVLFDSNDALGARDWGDVVALSEQPGESDLCRCCVCLGGNGLDL